ncbi:hypothetical protein ebA7 [Aromatoleum aromaticum EbN1]|uniref:Sel1 repeat family protein n=1 Tax=Aromatoleum aromaticum (strain DSM 19018 / LMG 30748 / EbN1) TaxID=76114 RepID=Q5P984_AROAE|nr:SEL1-like repeat protein [Aromatoleum aromaticum]CAI06125.1 hypothetical protein ebA7 [Aromatoleum aromaticum EbN1]
MTAITVPTAALILDRTTRTIWRRIADGSLPAITEDDRQKIPLDAVIREACIPIDPDDYELVTGTDAGDAESQCDLALLFLLRDRPHIAMPLLNLAAKDDYPEALYQIARCHIAGKGVPRDGNAGIMWLARAASRGHSVAQEQMRVVRESGTGTDLDALDALLERIEQRVVFAALETTATR